MMLIRDGEKGEGGMRFGGGGVIIYLSLHCHYQNDLCIKTLRWAAMRAILMFQ